MCPPLLQTGLQVSPFLWDLYIYICVWGGGGCGGVCLCLCERLCVCAHVCACVHVCMYVCMRECSLLLLKNAI